jgi:hypothetical protein
MNNLQAVLIIIIIIVTIIIEIILLFVNPTYINNLPDIIKNSIPAGKKCEISGDVWDYGGKKLTDGEVPCTQCIDYIAKTTLGCTPMEYDNDKKCRAKGDPRPCPLNPTTYAEYTIK